MKKKTLLLDDVLECLAQVALFELEPGLESALGKNALPLENDRRALSQERLFHEFFLGGWLGGREKKKANGRIESFAGAAFVS